MSLRKTILTVTASTLLSLEACSGYVCCGKTYACGKTDLVSLLCLWQRPSTDKTGFVSLNIYYHVTLANNILHFPKAQLPPMKGGTRIAIAQGFRVHHSKSWTGIVPCASAVLKIPETEAEGSLGPRS